MAHDPIKKITNVRQRVIDNNFKGMDPDEIHILKDMVYSYNLFDHGNELAGATMSDAINVQRKHGPSVWEEMELNKTTPREDGSMRQFEYDDPVSFVESIPQDKREDFNMLVDELIRIRMSNMNHTQQKKLKHMKLGGVVGEDNGDPVIQKVNKALNDAGLPAMPEEKFNELSSFYEGDEAKIMSDVQSGISQYQKSQKQPNAKPGPESVEGAQAIQGEDLNKVEEVEFDEFASKFSKIKAIKKSSRSIKEVEKKLQRYQDYFQFEYGDNWINNAKARQDPKMAEYAQVVPQFKQDVKSIEKMSEDLKNEMVERQVEIDTRDEFQKTNPNLMLPSWQKRRARALQSWVTNALVEDPLSLVSLASRKIGLTDFANSIDDNVAAIRGARESEFAMPSRLQGGLYKDYVIQDGRKIFVDEDGKFINAVDPETGILSRMSESEIETFNSMGGKDVKRDTSGLRMINNLEHSAYDLASLIGGGIGVAKGVVKAGAKKATKKKIASGYTAGAVVYQSYSDNFADMMDKLDDPDAASTAAFTKSVLSGLIENVAGLDKLPMNMKMGLTKIVDDVALRYATGKITRGQVAKEFIKEATKKNLGEVAEELMDAQKDKLIDYAYNVQSDPLLNWDEVTETGLSTMALMLPLAGAAGWNHASPHNLQGNAFYSAAKDPERFLEVASEAVNNGDITQDEADARVDIVTSISKDLPYIDDLSEDDQAMYSKLKAQKLTLEKVLSGTSVDSDPIRKKIQSRLAEITSAMEGVVEGRISANPPALPEGDPRAPESNPVPRHEKEQSFLSEMGVKNPENITNDQYTGYFENESDIPSDIRELGTVVSRNDSGGDYFEFQVMGSDLRSAYDVPEIDVQEDPEVIDEVKEEAQVKMPEGYRPVQPGEQVESDHAVIRDFQQSGQDITTAPPPKSDSPKSNVSRYSLEKRMPEPGERIEIFGKPHLVTSMSDGVLKARPEGSTSVLKVNDFNPSMSDYSGVMIEEEIEPTQETQEAVSPIPISGPSPMPVTPVPQTVSPEGEGAVVVRSGVATPVEPNNSEEGSWSKISKDDPRYAEMQKKAAKQIKSPTETNVDRSNDKEIDSQTIGGTEYRTVDRMGTTVLQAKLGGDEWTDIADDNPVKELFSDEASSRPVVSQNAMDELNEINPLRAGEGDDFNELSKILDPTKLKPSSKVSDKIANRDKSAKGDVIKREKDARKYRERVKSKSGKKLLDTMIKAFPVAESLGMSVVLHESIDSFANSIADAGNDPGIAASSNGYFRTDTNEIHIPLYGRVKENVFLHEVIHPVLSIAAANNPDLIQNLASQLLSDPDLKSRFFDGFGNRFYDGDQAKVEALVEFMADRAFAQMMRNDGSRSLVQKFIDYFKELVSALGGDPSVLSKKQDLFEFADGLAQVLSNGVPLIDGDGIDPSKINQNIYQSRKTPITSKEALAQIKDKSKELNDLGYSAQTLLDFYKKNGVDLNIKEVEDALSSNKQSKPDEKRVLESVKVFDDRGWSSSKIYQALKDIIPGLKMSDVLKAKGKIKSEALSKEYNTEEMKDLEVDYRKRKLEQIYGIPKGTNPAFSQDDINKAIVDRRLDEPDIATAIADGVINMREQDPTNIRVGQAEDAGMAIAMDKLRDELSKIEDQMSNPSIDPSHKKELADIKSKLLAQYLKIGSALQISRSAAGRQLASYKSSKFRLDEHKVILELSEMARNKGETLTDDDIATIRRMFRERDELEKAVNDSDMSNIKDTLAKMESLATIEFKSIKGGKFEDVGRIVTKIKSLFDSARNKNNLQHSMDTTFDEDSSGRTYDLNTYRTLLLELIKGVKAKKDINTLGGVINYIVQTEPRIKSNDIVEALVFHANRDALIKDYQQRIKQIKLTQKEHSALSDLVLSSPSKKPSKKNVTRMFQGLGRFRNRSFLSNMLVSEIGEVNTAIDDILHTYNEIHFVKPHGLDVEAAMERMAASLDLISKNFKLDKVGEVEAQWLGMIEDIKAGDYSRVDQLTNPIDQTLIKDKTRKLHKSLNDKELEISEFARSRYSAWYSKLGSIPDLMRSVRLSVDASAALVQGAKVTVRMLATNPSKVYENIALSLRAGIGEVTGNSLKGLAEQQFHDIISHPFQEKREKADLKVSRPGGGYESGEEYFTSDLARKIPLLGRLIAGSDAAMTVYLNAIRVGQFDSYLMKNPMASDEELAVVAAHINTSTGVTNFGSAKERKDLEGVTRIESFQKAFMGGLPFANFAFIATRLYASNFVYILNTPWQVMKAIGESVKGDPSANAYMYALKDKAITLGMFTGIYAATKALFDAMGHPCSISYNPRSSAFMKLHCGERTMGITGGAESYVRLIAQMMTKSKEGYDFQEVDNSIDSRYFNMNSMKDLAFTFLEHKITPFNGFMFSVASDTDFIGRPLPEGWDKVAYYMKNILPISIQNFWEEMGVADLVITPPTTVISFFGGQILHYDNAIKHNLAVDHMKKVDYKPSVGSQMRSEDYDFIKASDYLKSQFKQDVEDKWGNWLVQSLERGVEPDRKEMLEIMKEVTEQTLYEYQRENL